MNPRKPRQEDLKVFITSRESKCDECKEDLGSKAWIMLAGQKRALCLSCADLDHLACTKYSGRVGRSAAAKALDEYAVRLAVVAHVRHVQTPYDELLMSGWERGEARHQVEDAVRAVLAEWRNSPAEEQKL